MIFPSTPEFIAAMNLLLLFLMLASYVIGTAALVVRNSLHRRHPERPVIHLSGRVIGLFWLTVGAGVLISIPSLTPLFGEDTREVWRSLRWLFSGAVAFFASLLALIEITRLYWFLRGVAPVTEI